MFLDTNVSLLYSPLNGELELSAIGPYPPVKYKILCKAYPPLPRVIKPYSLALLPLKALAK